jgi:hypothetical protein
MLKSVSDTLQPTKPDEIQSRKSKIGEEIEASPSSK